MPTLKQLRNATWKVKAPIALALFGLGGASLLSIAALEPHTHAKTKFQSMAALTDVTESVPPTIFEQGRTAVPQMLPLFLGKHVMIYRFAATIEPVFQGMLTEEKLPAAAAALRTLRQDPAASGTSIVEPILAAAERLPGDNSGKAIVVVSDAHEDADSALMRIEPDKAKALYGVHIWLIGADDPESRPIHVLRDAGAIVTILKPSADRLRDALAPNSLSRRLPIYLGMALLSCLGTALIVGGVILLLPSGQALAAEKTWVGVRTADGRALVQETEIAHRGFGAPVRIASHDGGWADIALPGTAIPAIALEILPLAQGKARVTLVRGERLYLTLGEPMKRGENRELLNGARIALSPTTEFTLLLSETKPQHQFVSSATGVESLF